MKNARIRVTTKLWLSEGEEATPKPGSAGGAGRWHQESLSADLTRAERWIRMLDQT